MFPPDQTAEIPNDLGGEPVLVETDALESPTPGHHPAPRRGETRSRAEDGDEAFRVGRVIVERYLLERRLGGGAMGEVFLARDRLLKKQVALKVLRTTLAKNRSTVRRFLREVALAHSVTHPNVVRIYDTGEAFGLPYFSMEFLQGQTLDELVGTSGEAPPMTIREIRDLCVEILDGLEAAHQVGVIHRDLKPANVILTHRGAIVMDFGVAGLDTLPSPVPDPSEARSLIRTEAGTIFGSPAYMAPELWEGSPATVQSDLYSFGVMLYQLLSGRLPYEAKNAKEFLEKLRNTRPAPVRSLRKDTPWNLALLVHRCMASNPDERPTSAAAAAAVIAPLAGRRRRLGVGLGAVALAGVLAAVGLRGEPSYTQMGLPDAVAEHDLAAAIRSWDAGDHVSAQRQLDRLEARAYNSAAVGFWRATVEHDAGDETARLAFCSGREFEGSAGWIDLATNACAEGYSLGEPVLAELHGRTGRMGPTYLPVAVLESLVPRLETASAVTELVNSEARSVLARLGTPPRWTTTPAPVRYDLARFHLTVAMGELAQADDMIAAMLERHAEATAVANAGAWYYGQRGDLPRAEASAKSVSDLDPRAQVQLMMREGRMDAAWDEIEAAYAGPYFQSMTETWCGYALRYEVEELPTQCDGLLPGLASALWDPRGSSGTDRAVMSSLERTIVVRQQSLDLGHCLERIERGPVLTHATAPFETYLTQLQISAALCGHNPVAADLDFARSQADALVAATPGDPWALLLQAQVDDAVGASGSARRTRAKVAATWSKADGDLPLVRRLRRIVDGPEEAKAALPAASPTRATPDSPAPDPEGTLVERD